MDPAPPHTRTPPRTGAPGRWRRWWPWWVRARPYVVPAVLLLTFTLPHLHQGAFRQDTGRYAAVGVQM